MDSLLSSGLTIPTNPAPAQPLQQPAPISTGPSNNDALAPLPAALQAYYDNKTYELDTAFMKERTFDDDTPDPAYARRSVRTAGLIAYVTSDLSPERAKQATATFGRTSPYRQDKYTGMLVGRALCANSGYAGDPLTFIRHHGQNLLGLQVPQTGYSTANELYSLIGTTFATQQRNAYTKAIQAEQARAKALEETRNRILPGAITRAVTNHSITPEEDAILKSCGITKDSLAKVRALTGAPGLAKVDPSSTSSYNAANSLNGLHLLGLEHNASLKGVSLFDRDGLYKAARIIGQDDKARLLYLNLMRIAGRQHRDSHHSSSFFDNFASSTAELLQSVTRSVSESFIDVGYSIGMGAAALAYDDAPITQYKALVAEATDAFAQGYAQRDKELTTQNSDTTASRILWNLADFPTTIKEPVASTAPYLNAITAVTAIGKSAVDEQNLAAANAKGDPNAGFLELGLTPTARGAIFGASIYGTGWATGKLVGGLSKTSIGRSVSARIAISPTTRYAANVSEGIVTEAAEELVDAVGQDALEETLDAAGLIEQRQKRANWKKFTDLMQDTSFWGADIGMNLVFGAFGYKGSRSKSPYKDVLQQLGFSQKEQKSIQLELVKAHQAGAGKESLGEIVRQRVLEKQAANPQQFKERAIALVANAHQQESLRAAAANGVLKATLKKAQISNMEPDQDGNYEIERVSRNQDGQFEIVKEKYSEQQILDWLASDINQAVTQEILYTQSLVRGEQTARAATANADAPFSRIVSMLNAPAELLTKLDGKTSFDAETLALFSQYAIQEIENRIARGESAESAANAEFGTTGATLGAVSRLSADFDTRVANAVAQGEISDAALAQSNAYILPGKTPADNILMLARGEATAKDIAHDWLESFGRSRYLANPQYWQQALTALDNDLTSSGILSQSLFNHTPEERDDLEYIEAFSHLAELSFLADHGSLTLSDNSHGILDEVLDDLGAVQGGLELAAALSQYLTSDAAKNAVGQALDPLRGILSEAGASLTDLLTTAEQTAPKTAADFILRHQENIDQDVRTRLADLASAATNPAPINTNIPKPDSPALPDSVTDTPNPTTAQLAQLNGLNQDGTRPAPANATYTRIDPKKNGRSLIGGLAHGLPDGSISGSAKLADISPHPTIGNIDPAHIRPNEDEKEIICYRKADGTLQAIGNLAYLSHATNCGVENVPVRVYPSGKKYNPQWAAKTAAESKIRSGAASTANILAYLTKHALTRDAARRHNLIPKDTNGQELPASRAAWLLLQHATKKTIADTISGKLSITQALSTIESKAAALLKAAAQPSLPGFQTSSFSVIGKNARTWDKYASRAFKGRDDGMDRAEIDASKATVAPGILMSDAERNLETFLDFFNNSSKPTIQQFKNYIDLSDDLSDALEYMEANRPGAEKVYSKLFKQRKALELKITKKLYEHTKSLGIHLNGTLSPEEIIHLFHVYYYGRHLKHPQKLLEKFGNTQASEAVSLSEILDFPELYEAYPQLKHYAVALGDFGTSRIRGQFSKAQDYIEIHRNLLLDDYNLKSVLLHEVQHAIQAIEGFVRGGNENSARNEYNKLANSQSEQAQELLTLLQGKDDYDLYLRLGGEIEARNVQKRMSMDNNMRDSIPFNQTLEYPGESIVPSSFSLTTSRRKYMPLSEAVKLEEYIAMEDYARRLYRDATALAQANPKNKLDDAVRAAMHLRALLNAVFSRLPKDAQPWKALGHARKQIDSLTWAVSHSYANLDPHQAPGISPAEIEKYNESGYRDRRQWLTNKLSRLIVSVADSAARSIEAHACRTLLATAETAVKTLLPKTQKSGKERRGITSADVYTKAIDFYKMFDWGTAERTKELTEISDTLNDPDLTDQQRIEAEKRRQAILCFAGLNKESLPRVKAGVELLLAYIRTGRLKWEEKLLEERRATEAIQEAIATLNPKIEHSKTTAKEDKKRGGFANLFTSLLNPIQTLTIFANLPGKVGEIYTNLRAQLATAQDNKTYAIQQAHQDAAHALDTILGIENKNSLTRQIERADFLTRMNRRKNTGIFKQGRVKITTFQFTQQDILDLQQIRQEQGQQAFITAIDKHRRKYDKEDALTQNIPYEEVFQDALSQLKSPDYRGGTIFVEHTGPRDTAHQEELILTPLQAANLWLLAQQPSYSNKYDQDGNLIERGMLDTLGYTDHVIARLETFIGPQLRAYALWKREYLNTTGLFEAYEQHMGLPFPKEENYWPGAFDTVANTSGLDALQTAYAGNGVYNMLILRKKHLSEPNLSVDIEAAWEHAISQHYHYIHLSPITRQLRAITRDADTRQRLRKIAGNAALDNVQTMLNTLDGAPALQLQAASHANNLFMRWFTPFAKALLNMATGTTVKQTSAIGHALAYNGINWLNIAPKLLTTTLSGITRIKRDPGHKTPQEILKLKSFRVRINREDLGLIASRLAPGETQSKLAIIDLLGSRFLEYADAGANSIAMAAVYNTEYDTAKKIMLAANNGSPLTPEQQQQLADHCENTVSVLLKQAAQPLEKEDKPIIQQQKNFALSQNYFMMGEILSKVACFSSIIKAGHAAAYGKPLPEARRIITHAWAKGLSFYSGMGIASQSILALLSYFIGSAPDAEDEDFSAWILSNILAGAIGFSYLNALPFIGEALSTAAQSIYGTHGVFATYATTGIGITYKDLEELFKLLDPDKPTAERVYSGSNLLRITTTMLGFFCSGVKGANTVYELFSAANNINNLIRPGLQRAKNDAKKEQKELKALTRQQKSTRKTRYTPKRYTPPTTP